MPLTYEAALKEIKCIVVNLCYYFSMITLYDYCIKNNKEHLLKEWDYELNKDLDIKTILTGSNKKVWWHCPKCNGQWQATVYDRTRKDSTGCPYCAGQKVLKGYNDLATKYPECPICILKMSG